MFRQRPFATRIRARCGGGLGTDVIVGDGGGDQVGEEGRRQDTRYGQGNSRGDPQVRVYK